MFLLLYLTLANQNLNILITPSLWLIKRYACMQELFLSLLYTRYSSKYRNTKNRLRELGLLDSNFTGSIFILDDWEIPREKLVLNRKLGEGAFGAVFGGESMGLKESEVSVPVAVKTLRVGATIEDKVRVCVSSCTFTVLGWSVKVLLECLCYIQNAVIVRDWRV